MKRMSVFVFIGLSLVLAACSTPSFLQGKEDEKLPGERISLFELQSNIAPEDIIADAQGMILPESWENHFWPQAGGYPNHAMQHLAFGQAPLERVWKSSIGRGSRADLPLTAQPIIAGNSVFTLDSRATLSAFDIETGRLRWAKDISLKGKKEDHVVAGGIGFGDDILVASNGRNVIQAFNPATGDQIWQHDIKSPVRAAPTILNGIVYVTTLDSRLFALNVRSGTPIWDHQGLGDVSGLLGHANPAATSQLVVTGYSSGEVYALRPENGATIWTDNLSGLTSFAALTKITDIQAAPIIDKGTVFVASYGGRLVAFDERTGQRIWQKEISLSRTPWVAGNQIFLISADNNLIALNRDTGAYRWTKNMGSLSLRKDKPLSWTRPILAGGRLYIFSSDGEALTIDPETGDMIQGWKAEGPVILDPVLAKHTMFVLDEHGNLSAYK